MLTRHPLLLTLITVALLAPAGASWAHGDNPLPLDVHALPDGSWVLMTNFGVMTSDQPTRYVCEEIFLGGMNYQVLPFDTRTWLTLSADQLARTEDGGCTFTQLSAREVAPSAVARSRDGDLVAWVDNLDGEQSALTWSEDRGETLDVLDLSGLGAIRWTSLHVMGAHTLIAAGYSEEMARRGEARVFRVDVSRAGEIEEIAGWESARYPYLFDARAGRVAGIANIEGSLSLLWDEPEEAVGTRSPLELWPVDMRLSDDGERLGVAGATERGAAMIYERSDQGALVDRTLFEQDATSCVGWRSAEDLMVCARSSAQDFALATGSIDSGIRETLVDFQKLEGPIQGCAPDTPLQKSCALVWPELARALRIDLPEEPALDMGGPSGDQQDMSSSPDMDSSQRDADPDTPDMTPSSRNDGGTCATFIPSHQYDRNLIFLVLLGFIFGLRRRRVREV